MKLRTILRMVELIICAVIYVLWYAMTYYGSDALCYGTVFAFLIITAILLTLEFVKFNSTPVYIIIGAILSILSGILIAIHTPGDTYYTEDGRHSGNQTTYFLFVILFLANGAIFLVDFIVVLKGGKSGGD